MTLTVSWFKYRPVRAIFRMVFLEKVVLEGLRYRSKWEYATQRDGLLFLVPSERLRLECRPARFPCESGSAGRRLDLCADSVGPSPTATLSRDVRSLMITSPER